MRRRMTGLAALVGLGIVLSSCGYNVPADMVAVHVKNGPNDSKQVVGCVPSASRKHWWQTNDDYPLFPTSEREWDATGQTGSDSKPFQSVTQDKVIMDIPVTVRFTLKTDCDTLMKFYTSYARRNGVAFKADGTFDETGTNYNEAWITTLRKLVADPTDQTLDRIVQQYKWQDVWNNPKTKVAIEQQLDQALESNNSLLVQTAKASYFDGISVLVGTPQPDNPALAEQVASTQTLVAEAQAEEAQADADRKKALAQVAVAKAEAAKQQATINGYRLKGMSAAQALKAYNQNQAILAGLNPFQPVIVAGGGAITP